jgi:hypothetical protein
MRPSTNMGGGSDPQMHLQQQTRGRFIRLQIEREREKGERKRERDRERERERERKREKEINSAAEQERVSGRDDYGDMQISKPKLNS